jgi:Uma2 family endonuclease
VNEDHAMDATSERVRMTYDDLAALPDDGLRHELIDGVHFVTPSPALVHQLIVGNLHRLIANYVQARSTGVVLVAPFDVVLSIHDVVEPDLIYFSRKRYKQVVTEKNAQGPPDLAIEILSPGTRRRDETLKRQLYERVGVAEYWIVDPKTERVSVHTLDGARYRRRELSRAAGEVIGTSLLPGLSLPLSAIFARP